MPTPPEGISSLPVSLEQGQTCFEFHFLPVALFSTDLDRFSVAEAAILENHGYLLAQAAVRHHLKHLIQVNAPLRLPTPAWMDESEAAPAVKDSWKRVVFGH
jgi:hypothetical protein